MLDSDTLIDVTRRMKSLKIENDRRLSRYENEQNEQNEPVTSTVTSSVSLNSKIASTMNSLNIYSINESKLKVNPREPNWADLPKLNGLILEYFLPTNVNVIKDPEHFRKSEMNSKNFSFKIAPYPFDRGAERSAFFGFDLTRKERMYILLYNFF
ncbi:29308_t:CDS:2 [Gigaspora margarita]|uniref:29308_t:CDS:1 n=1 Tax=Gigaspora margarita TaxID=4874 RepID=A0ABN7UWK5_GIGMA|nr:29308_t:CDS:2 [Gigaspora margarita]